MKIVRKITYEGTEEQLQQQMLKSLPLGTHPWMTTITVEHVEGPQWPYDGVESVAILEAHFTNIEGDV
ncbi:hypothetical protein LCGC14_1508610 [marine sediment metagenome]|uniref:Uncharacterized protein n=1 Tax=marine sediment metagenome TaxID=412755 RepID=A0A0F9J298_9ZZZZ